MAQTLTPLQTPLFKVFMPKSVMPALEETLFSGYVAEGKKVSHFTSLVADYIGNPRTVLVNSCTTAITIAYRLAGVGPGTEVISTPLTCVASNHPILELGATPVWADVDPNTGMIDPNGLEKLINERTRAILILHKEGDPARIDEILSIAKKHKVKVVEDAAHAFGSKYKGKMIGNHGDFACFSFQAIKHITTGDGGALVCKSDDDFARAKRLKWFGVDKDAPREISPWLEDITEWGYKGNMNDISAAIGIEQMKHLDEIVNSHNKNGTLYSDCLKNVPGVKLISRSAQDFSTYWAYCVLVENRTALEKKLKAEGVGASQIHPRNDVYSVFSKSIRPLPGVDYFAPREIALPCGWWVSENDVRRIANILKSGW